MALSRADIIESVQKRLGCPQKKSTELVEQFIETIKSTPATGEDLLISGFGKFLNWYAICFTKCRIRVE